MAGPFRFAAPICYSPAIARKDCAMEHRPHKGTKKVELAADRSQHGQFPRVRMRRNRTSDWSRRLVRETNLTFSSRMAARSASQFPRCLASTA